jgi:DNA primase
VRAMTLHEAIVYGHGVERSFLCPHHGDSRPSASVNIVKGVYYCYTCGARGGLTGEDALLEPDYEEMRIWFEQKMEAGHVYPESWLSRWDAGEVHSYWAERVGVLAAKNFRLGYDHEQDMVTYPLRDPSGQVLGVVRRALGDDHSGPKYLYPAGVDVGRLLFNYTPELRRYVVLVEGALDAIACWNIGVDAFAIYGSRLSDAQRLLIDRVDPEVVYTAYDNDDAGYKAYLETKHAFRHRRVVRISWGRAWGKDVDELSETRRKFVFADVVSGDLSCVESASCRSPESTRTQSRLRILSSKST